MEYAIVATSANSAGSSLTSGSGTKMTYTDVEKSTAACVTGMFFQATSAMYVHLAQRRRGERMLGGEGQRKEEARRVVLSIVVAPVDVTWNLKHKRKRRISSVLYSLMVKAIFKGNTR